MWTVHAECYGVSPVVAVVPLLNQILSILNKRTLLIRLSYQLQIQVHRQGSAAGTSTYRACVRYGYNWYKYIGRGQLLQVQRPVSAAGTDSIGKAPGESTKCTVSFTGIDQLQVQEQKAGVIFSLSTWSGVSCRYRYIGKGQLKAQVQGKG